MCTLANNFNEFLEIRIKLFEQNFYCVVPFLLYLSKKETQRRVNPATTRHSRPVSMCTPCRCNCALECIEPV